MRLAPADRLTGERAFGATPTYWCPGCDAITEFRLGWKQAFAPEAVERAFQQAMGPLQAWEQDYSNFECRLCHQQVRCIHDVHEFAMSSYRHIPRWLLVDRGED
ncbi:hypothetical protein HNQ51_002453 [Inhella inkyongensis]|uniref:Uncharacterized protein n=1 Tax=Inhella inkyongensis TaxID=392593 RepID=A0A840S8L1_9BURK|nr:hypothetical protein [Inhella inkyongensis]MBB5205134.1 hypothetical protein [Inhella inkyongensis]